MRPFARAALVLAVTAFSFALAPTSPRAAASKCVPDGYEVVKRTSVGVVVGLEGHDGRLWGCSFGAPRLRALDSKGFQLDDLVSMKGGFVAATLKDCLGEGNCYFIVEVLNITTGKRRDAHLIDGCPENVQSCAGFTDVAVSASGSVAWIQQGGQDPQKRIVAKCESACLAHGGRKPRRLDTGRGIRLTSLTLSSGHLRWRNGSDSRTAGLP